MLRRLCDELDRTTSLLELALGLGADVASLDDDGDGGNATLSEELGVTERQKIDDGSSVGRGAAVEVLLTELGGDERPELESV